MSSSHEQTKKFACQPSKSSLEDLLSLGQMAWREGWTAETLPFSISKLPQSL